jgi:hypothetical protein
VLFTSDHVLVSNSGPHEDYSFLFAGGAGKYSHCWAEAQINGTFTNCPLRYNCADLVRAVATATSGNSVPRRHFKWDNSGYQYVGRSYGVGSSVGLMDDHIHTLPSVQQYKYDEVGLVTETSCQYNRSAAYYISRIGNFSVNPALYLTLGALPNSNWTSINENSSQPQTPQSANSSYGPGYDFDTQNGHHDADSIVSVYSRPPLTFGDPAGYYFGIAAGLNYHELDKIQCQLKFRPANIEVAVAITNRTITTNIKESQNASSTVPNPDPRGHLRAYAMDNLRLSLVFNSLFGSTVGDAFQENIQNQKVRRNMPVSASATSDIILASVENAVTAMVDAVFVALKSAALSWDDTAPYTTPTEVTVSAVRIGSGAFILAVVIINTVALVAIIAIHTMLWKETVPMFDYNDLGSMIIAVATTKDDTMEALTANGNDLLSAWSGDPQSPGIGHLTVTLEVSSPAGQPAIALKYI